MAGSLFFSSSFFFQGKGNLGYTTTLPVDTEEIADACLCIMKDRHDTICIELRYFWYATSSFDWHAPMFVVEIAKCADGRFNQLARFKGSKNNAGSVVGQLHD